MAMYATTEIGRRRNRDKNVSVRLAVLPYLSDIMIHSFGKTGLESAQNFDLLTSNAFFMEKIQNEFKGEKDQGDTVVTTLDAELQQAAYDALGENKGTVIVMEADTGKYLLLFQSLILIRIRLLKTGRS